MRNSIRRRLILVFVSFAIAPLLLVGAILAWRSFDSLQQQSLLLQQEAAKRVSIQVASFFQDLESDMQFTIQTQGLEETGRDHTDALSHLLAYQPAFDELHLLNKQGREQVGVYRLGLTTAPVDRSKADEFTIPKTTGQVYYGSIFYDETTGEPLMTIAVPVINLRTGSVESVLVSVARIKKVWDLIAGIDVLPGQTIYVVDAQGKVVAHRNPSIVLRGTNFNVPEQNGVQFGLNNKRVVLAFDSMSLGQQQLSIISEQTITEALAPAINIVYVTLALVVMMAVLAGVSGLLSVRQIVQPVQALAAAAERIGVGDLTVQVQATSNDELGTLANTFNSMTSQLRDLITSLEQRVADRTKALTSVAEVSTAVSTTLETDRLLQQVVDLAKERFDLYHAHIYLLDEAGTSLVLASGAGAIGKQLVAGGHSIPLDREQSLVARTAREKKGVTVNDVTTEPGFLPNPLLPDTRAELAVPMMVGDVVVGVFDVQSETIGRFTDADIAVQTTLASQVASAVQNARSYTKIQRNQAQLSEALEIAKLANWEYDVARDRFIFNDHFYSIFHTTAELEGGYELTSAQYAERLVHPDDLPIVGTEIEKALGSKDRHYNAQLEHRVVYRDGGTGYITVNIHIERDSQGNIIRYYGANQDVTERRQLEELNRKRAVQQEALNLITQKIQNTTTVEAALQIAARELGHALGQKQTLVALNAVSRAGENKIVVNE